MRPRASMRSRHAPGHRAGSAGPDHADARMEILDRCTASAVAAVGQRQRMHLRDAVVIRATARQSGIVWSRLRWMVGRPLRSSVSPKPLGCSPDTRSLQRGSAMSNSRSTSRVVGAEAGRRAVASGSDHGVLGGLDAARGRSSCGRAAVPAPTPPSGRRRRCRVAAAAVAASAAALARMSASCFSRGSLPMSRVVRVHDRVDRQALHQAVAGNLGSRRCVE